MRTTLARPKTYTVGSRSFWQLIGWVGDRGSGHEFFRCGTEILVPMANTVTDNTEKNRYEVHTDEGELGAFVVYRLKDNVTELIHTETVAGFEGQGMAKQLVEGALADIRERGRQLRPYCPYVHAYLRKHPEQQDLVPAEEHNRWFGEES